LWGEAFWSIPHDGNQGIASTTWFRREEGGGSKKTNPMGQARRTRGGGWGGGGPPSLGVRGRGFCGELVKKDKMRVAAASRAPEIGRSRPTWTSGQQRVCIVMADGKSLESAKGLKK